MYIHNTIISAETYLEFVTGKHWDLKRPDQLQEMADILTGPDIPGYWSFSLNEIEKVIPNNSESGIVLVDVYGTTLDDSSMHHTYRWFEMPYEDPSVMKARLYELEQKNQQRNHTHYFS